MILKARKFKSKALADWVSGEGTCPQVAVFMLGCRRRKERGSSLDTRL